MTFIVFYHNPCPDGEMAKCIWNLKYPNSIYYKWNHKYTEENYNLVNTHNNETIIFLDICPNQELINDNNNYIIIDHHKNAIDKLTEKSNITKFCSTEFSGCQLCWQYLFNNKSYPIAVKHIGNYDIWDFEDKDTDFFCGGYNYTNEINFDYSSLLNINDVEYNKIIEMGKYKIISYKNIALESMKNIIVNVEKINNKNILFVNLTCKDPKVYKYLIDYVKQEYEGFNVLRIKSNDSYPIKYSLRSIDGITTVDDIARFYGGNGHPMAAGYKVDK